VDEVDRLENRKLHSVEPWAWTPGSHELLAPLESSLRHVSSAWDHSHTRLFRKSWGAKMSAEWFAVPGPEWMSGSDCVGIEVGRQNSLVDALTEIRSRGFQTAVFKPDLSASGKGMHRIETDSTNEKSFEKDIEAVVEPWLDRLVDLSFLWHCERDGQFDFLGWTRAEVSKGGRYQATVLGNPFVDCDADVRQFLLENKHQRLKETATWLESHLLPELTKSGFRGNFGVDAFVYRDAESGLKMRPFVELNPRMTMGHVAIALKKRIANGVKARFRILTRTQFESQFGKQMFSVPKMNRTGRIERGIIWFGEVAEGSKLVPCLVVGEHEKSTSHS
jgi:hypothetical protein